MVLHWLLVLAGLQKARTQTTDAESRALAGYAANKKNIVELGVFEGVNSLVLRQAMDAEGTLYCIDPFFPGFFGFSYGEGIARKWVARSSNGRVNFLKQFSYDAVRLYRKDIDMMFIDADHSYQAVRQDWEQWSPFVVEGGLVAFHDSIPMPGRCKPNDGPVVLVTELRREQDVFRVIDEVDTITFFQRLQGPA